MTKKERSYDSPYDPTEPRPGKSYDARRLGAFLTSYEILYLVVVGFLEAIAASSIFARVRARSRFFVLIFCAIF